MDYSDVYFVCRTPDVGIEWPRLDPSQEGVQYLHIKGPGNNVIDQDPDFGQMKFWNSINFAENKLGNQKIEL